MMVQQMYYFDNGFEFKIPPAPYGRRVWVPLLMATAFGKNAKASHKLIFNGVTVAEAEAVGGIAIPANIAVGITRVTSWSGYIEPNQTATIQAVAYTNNEASTPKCINVQFGGW